MHPNAHRNRKMKQEAEKVIFEGRSGEDTTRSVFVNYYANLLPDMISGCVKGKLRKCFSLS